MNKTFISALIFIIASSALGALQAATCTPADLTFCAFPVTGFKVARISDLDLGDGIANVDVGNNKLQIDAARYSYDESRIHTSTQCNANENNLIGSDIEIAFSLDPSDENNRTISEIWILPCSVFQPR